jgi:hypothetical protein
MEKWSVCQSEMAVLIEDRASFVEHPQRLITQL